MNTIPVPADNRSAAIARVSAFLSACLPGKALRVTVEEVKRKRSDEQNRYWWGVVVKTFWERIEGLGKARIRPVRRSSKLSKSEFGDLVLRAQQIGAEHGIYVPDPNEP
jgi:hypothetical protein